MSLNSSQRLTLLLLIAPLALLPGCADGVVGVGGSSGAVSETTTVKEDGTYQQVFQDRAGRTLTNSDRWKTAQPMGIPGVPADGSYIEMKNYVETGTLTKLPATAAELPRETMLTPRSEFQPTQTQQARSRRTTLLWWGALQLLATVFWVVEIVDVARRRFPGEGTKVGWVLVVVLLGCLGAAVYYLFGKSQGEIPGQNG